MPEEVNPEVLVKTQKSLGKFVKRPVLSEKLLKKPPFRFLHDIINTVIQETGFLKGLYTDAELNSDNVKERDAKVNFLTKLIDAVSTITKTELSVRPSKIVAGLEATETNLLLQTIAKALEKKLDSSEYVKRVNAGQITSNDKPKKSKVSKNTTEKKISSKTIKEKTSSKEKLKAETPKSTDRDKTKQKRSPKDSSSSKTQNEETKKKEKTKKLSKTTNETKNEIIDEVVKSENFKNSQINIVAEPLEIVKQESIIEQPPIETAPEVANIQPIENESVIKRSTSASRPKSARPRSGDLKEKNVEENPEPMRLQSRPKSSLRPPSVRPSSARPGAPRLRPESAFPLQEVLPMGKINVIVENFDKDNEEETVVIQSSPETVEENVQSVDTSIGTNKGTLVEEILKQIGDEKNETGEVENDWQKDVLFGKVSVAKETNDLRTLIQTLTKTANPLGKLLNYLHEDLDAMHAELESWTHTKRQQFDEIVKQKKLTSEMNKPLIKQLDQLNQDIRKVEEEIILSRSNILQNDAKIKKLIPN